MVLLSGHKYMTRIARIRVLNFFPSRIESVCHLAAADYASVFVFVAVATCRREGS